MVMCFLIQAAYASVAIVIFLVLVIALHLRTFDSSWGSISQALIFHQVRKYLLMLDIRKDHVKFWRPQMLLLVSNPLTCCDTIDFINDVKKGGLYVLGHVEIGDFEKENKDPCQQHFASWLSLVDLLKVKAFVELTMAPSVREGMQHLIRVSGLGGMKPNTICLGFYDAVVPTNSLISRGTGPAGVIRRKFYTLERQKPDANSLSQCGNFPAIRSDEATERLSPMEYVLMLQDIFKMNKNICLFRHFSSLNKEAIFKQKQKQYIDVWPVNVFRPETVNYFDNTCLFMLQLACILNMVPSWNKHTTMRIFMCTGEQNEETERCQQKLLTLLAQLRILGELETLEWAHVTALHSQTEEYATGESSGSTSHHNRSPPPKNYLQAMNALIKSCSQNTSVAFMYLPRVPSEGHLDYLEQLDILTAELPPTVLVYGVHPVTSTTL